ncbi:MAG: DUF2809 domain-containing protein [bacterium]
MRKTILLSLLIVTPAGFLFKLYPGPGRYWVNNLASGMLYEIFWCLMIFFLLPRKEYIIKIALSVFLVTCSLEVLQLWHPWILEQIRSTFLGRTIIGTTFCWWDFPYYVAGCSIGWLWMRILCFSHAENLQ